MHMDLSLTIRTIDIAQHKSPTSLGIHPALSESLLLAHFVATDPKFHLTGGEDSEGVLAGQTGHFMDFIMHIYLFHSSLLITYC